MPATRFEIVPDAQGCHARFISGGQIIWWTESYTRKANAQHAIDLVKALAAAAPVYDLT